MVKDSNQNNAFIAFDFGTKKIGVAIGQTVTLSANPLKCLAANKGIPDWSQISILVSEWRPAGFIVGVPLNMDSTTQAVTFKARRFSEELRQRFKLPVYEVDERLTTVEARRQLFELGGYQALKQISVDSFAAKLMLEDWMRLNIPLAGRNS